MMFVLFVVWLIKVGVDKLRKGLVLNDNLILFVLAEKINIKNFGEKLFKLQIHLKLNYPDF